MRWNLRKKSENVSENKNSDKLTNERKVPSAVIFFCRARSELSHFQSAYIEWWIQFNEMCVK